MGVGMRFKMFLTSIVMCFIAFFIFAYGLYAVTPQDPISGSYMAVLGIFLGMGGLFTLLFQIAPGSASK